MTSMIDRVIGALRRSRPQDTPRCWKSHWNGTYRSVHTLPGGRYCDETNEQFARRMLIMCQVCGKPGHLACVARLAPGESITFEVKP